MSNQIFDVIIVGGGPIGLACGVEAQKQGLDYLILEKGALTNSIYNYPINMRFFSTSDRLEMAGIPFMSVENKPTRTEALEYYRRIYFHFKLKVNLYEGVKTLEKKDDNFLITTSKGSYQTRKNRARHRLLRFTKLDECPRRRTPKSDALLQRALALYRTKTSGSRRCELSGRCSFGMLEKRS